MGAFLGLPSIAKILLVICFILFIFCIVFFILWRHHSDDMGLVTVQISNLKRALKSTKTELEDTEEKLRNAEKEIELYKKELAMRGAKIKGVNAEDIVVDEENIAASEAAAENEASTVNKKNPSEVRILVAEDSKVSRDLIVTVLNASGYETEEAEDGKKAVELFANSPENYYSFILMDMNMPNLNGHDATIDIRRLDREDSKTVPIVALTANSFAEDIQESIEAGMNEFIKKPIEPQELISCVERLTA